MTLALALRCSDGLVLATDSRASGGPLGAADISEKFLQVNRDIGIMTYGLAEPGYRTMRSLVETVRSDPRKFAVMKNIVDEAVVSAGKEYQQFVTANPTQKSNPVGFIIAGFDGNESGLFKIFHFVSDKFDAVEQDETIAAQWPLPLALIPYLTFSGMSVRQGTSLAVMVMILTSTYNETVGGPIRLATVTLDLGFSLRSEHEVQELIELTQPKLVGMKRAWAEGWLTGSV